MKESDKACEESCKACEESYKVCEESLLGQGVFGIFFLEKRFLALLKIVYYDIVEAFFKRKAPEVNANFYVFESQCPKIMVSLKALKAKLSSIPRRPVSIEMRGRKTATAVVGLCLTSRHGNASEHMGAR